jgi:hypothetical protein
MQNVLAKSENKKDKKDKEDKGGKESKSVFLEREDGKQAKVADDGNDDSSEPSSLRSLKRKLDDEAENPRSSKVPKGLVDCKLVLIVSLWCA